MGYVGLALVDKGLDVISSSGFVAGGSFIHPVELLDHNNSWRGFEQNLTRSARLLDLVSTSSKRYECPRVKGLFVANR